MQLPLVHYPNPVIGHVAGTKLLGFLRSSRLDRAEAAAWIEALLEVEEGAGDDKKTPSACTLVNVMECCRRFLAPVSREDHPELLEVRGAEIPIDARMR